MRYPFQNVDTLITHPFPTAMVVLSQYLHPPNRGQGGYWLDRYERELDDWCRALEFRIHRLMAVFAVNAIMIVLLIITGAWG